MSSRKDSLKRMKRLERATRGHDFEKNYTMDGEEEETRSLNRYFWILIALGVAALVTAGIILWLFFGSLGGEKEVAEPQVSEEPMTEATMPPMVDVEDDAGEESSLLRPELATFLQGPKSWKEKRDWSGKWGKQNFDGGSFGGFGCGLCVMANMYSSFTPYQCSPVDMYRYAKETSPGYEGGGAIDWPHIVLTLESLGFTVDTGRKPKRYKQFRKLISESVGAMVVISSNDDDSYWKDTPGHYVSILAYDPEQDTVFLGDSGDPEHNRSWVSLKLIYKAVKKSNALHYLRVLAYDETKDLWKHKKISGKWVKPPYWKK